MDAADHRLVVSQLAEDLSWLEDHCRRQPDLARQAVNLRLAAGLVRNVLGPFLNGQAPTPLHIAVVGGAGAGKSTIVNFLTGANVAEANPQAGYTRHPTAYLPHATRSAWPAHAGFLGTLQRLSQPSPANLDEDVYQVRHVAMPGVDPPANDQGFGPLGDCVIWDCPDMTTWAATGYVQRLMEIASLADIIIYVASDERYNDEVPTQFLHLLFQAGKPVVVCLTKMREADAANLVAHFQSEVLGRSAGGSPERPNASLPPVVAVPFLTCEQLADPVRLAAKYRVPLLNQVLALADPADACRRRTIENAERFLTTAGDSLLEVARQDLSALDNWRTLVQTGQSEFVNRYHNEFLNGERFRRFDDAREQLMNLLELPGAGKLLSMVLWFIRAPYRLTRGFMGKALTRQDAGNLSENDVLTGGMRAWLDLLRAEALRRADAHPMWRHIVNGFNGGLGDSATDRFGNDLRRFQMHSSDEIDAICRSLTAGLEQNQSLLASLRVGKLLLDATAVGLAFWAGGLTWLTILYVLIFASLAHQLVEIVVWQVVEQKRATMKAHREAMVNQYLAVPLGDWLTQWPSTGGSAYERLQMTMQRVPQSIKELGAAVEKRLQSICSQEPVAQSGDGI
jgi:GTPase SAR1 family protein